MRSTRTFVHAALFVLVAGASALPACSCSDEAAGLGGDSGVFLDPDGNFIDGDGNFIEVDGASSIHDDAGTSGDDDGAVTIGDGAIGGDGGLTPGDDGGSPLEEPLSSFCSGEGSVVIVGASGECAGELAEETFQFAVCACDTITAQSTLTLDAFDSTRGTYGSTLAMGGVNILDDGHLGTNGPLMMPGKLTVHGTAFIGGGGLAVGSQSLVTSTVYANGDAVQGNSSTTLGRNAFFNGDVSGRFEIAGDLHVPPGATISQGTLDRLGGSVVRTMIPAVRPCPCAESELLDIGALTEFGRTHNDNAVTRVLTSTTWENGEGPSMITLPCGRYYVTRIVTPSQLVIRAEGRTVLFVDGDMTIGGSFNLELADGAEVDLFIKGSLSVGASARFGTPSAPSKVRTYVGGAGQIVLSASAVFGGNLYAPRADVIFDASADLYGALFARTADFSGSASIHFDSAIRSAGDSCEMPDAGTDGGVGDAGTPTDAGTPPTDAGTPSDAGTPG
ncbi:hypothetical protein L6R52_32550, partial [Myxococcota bacterium]|nr:hypothetical protein [Myxococcota bacterium]